MGSLYARPTDIVQPTWSLTAGTAESDGPVSALGDLKPYVPFRCTSGTCTARATFGGATTLQGIVFVAHSLGGETVTITNNAGLNTSLVVPADTADGLSVHAWKDLRGMSNTSATTWDLAMSGATPDVAIGEVLLIQTVRTLQARWRVKTGSAYPIDEERTEFDVPLIYQLGIRNRMYEARVSRESERSDMLRLFAAARGRALAWWLVPDETENDTLYARFASTSFELERESPRVTDMVIDVEEVGIGPAVI